MATNVTERIVRKSGTSVMGVLLAEGARQKK
ncbi:hypothetical protein Pan216_36130 [Planctomycetes bacterium Pan216]|uniref:Uncharacterized protein n=1 Tax=Kolteria novifilia TaxID=2527975 RepID=A0A518B714_9BACT|nr:hypothetical protein Pan216_36130 [Planctomycetes bacterium Pan216]